MGKPEDVEVARYNLGTRSASASHFLTMEVVP